MKKLLFFYRPLLFFILICPSLLPMNFGASQASMQAIAQNLDHMRQKSEEAYRRQHHSLHSSIDLLHREQLNLARRKEQGLIGATEYEVQSKMIERKMNSAEKELEALKNNSDKIGAMVTDIISGGAQVLMDTMKDEATRKTQIAAAAASAAAAQEVENEGNLAKLRILTDPATLKNMALYSGITIGGSMLAWQASKLGYSYLQRFIGMPTLVRETSDQGLKGMLLRLFEQKTSLEDIFSGIIFPSKEVADAVNRIALATLAAKKSDIPQRGVIFYGPPGTGKTLMAKAIATRSKVGFAIISGSDLSQFGKGAVQQLHELWDRAEREAARDGAFIVVIDEADACLGDRRSGTDKDGEGRKVLNAFLQRTGAKSKVKIMLLTNDLKSLDPAVLDRASEQIEIPFHDQPGRVAVLKYYLQKYYGPGNKQGFKVAEDLTDEALDELAGKLEGFSGRKLEDIVGLIQDQLALAGDRIVTLAHLHHAADEKIRQRDTALQYKF